MEFLPLLVAAALAALLARPALASLAEEGFVRENFRGRTLPFPGGTAVVAAAVVALVPLALLHETAGGDVLRPELRVVAVVALGVAFLGLVDDVLSAAPRGWRGHGAALLRGRFTTGALKAGGTAGLALYALSDLALGTGEYLLAAALLTVTTNLFNLLDLRPGRAVKAFVLLGALVTLGAWDVAPLWALGLFAGPVVVLGWFDLRERTMLGDTGANVIGALAGLWLVLALPTPAQAVALTVVLAVTAYGEFRSISSWVERTPGPRHLDALGRVP